MQFPKQIAVIVSIGAQEVHNLTYRWEIHNVPVFNRIVFTQKISGLFRIKATIIGNLPPRFIDRLHLSPISLLRSRLSGGPYHIMSISVGIWARIAEEIDMIYYDGSKVT